MYGLHLYILVYLITWHNSQARVSWCPHICLACLMVLLKPQALLTLRMTITSMILCLISTWTFCFEGKDQQESLLIIRFCPCTLVGGYRDFNLKQMKMHRNVVLLFNFHSPLSLASIMRVLPRLPSFNLLVSYAWFLPGKVLPISVSKISILLYKTCKSKSHRKQL